MPHAEVFRIAGAADLALAVRLSGHLRLPELQLWMPYAMIRNVEGLKRLISAERGRTEAGLQTRAWRLGIRASVSEACCTLQSQFFDNDKDRLMVRSRVYARALALARDGKPSVEQITAAIREDIAPGHLATNPHCASAALRAHSGVCQAISVYAQQLMLRCGYPAIIRTGVSGGVPHSWNEIRADDGSWHTYDLSIRQPVVEYTYDDVTPAGIVYEGLTRGLQRTVTFRRSETTVNGLLLPFSLGTEREVYPTRLAQAFNGAYWRTEQGLMCCLGKQAHVIPFTQLTETPNHVPVMRTDAFASLFAMDRPDGRTLRFTEGL